MDEINKIEEEKQNKLEEKERLKQQEREKREQERQQEKDKKEAEKLKLKEEKDKIKLEKKIELEKQKEQEKVEKEKLKEEKKQEKEREKEEKKKAKLDAKLDKQTQKCLTNEKNIEKTEQLSIEQTLIKKGHCSKDDSDEKVVKVSPNKSEALNESKISDNNNSSKRGRGRPKGSKNKPSKEDKVDNGHKENNSPSKTEDVGLKASVDESKQTSDKPSLLKYFSKS